MRYLCMLIFLFPTILFGQVINDSLLAAFYNKTLTYYFSDTTVNKDQLKFGCILLETDIDTNRLVKSVGTNKFKYFNSRTSFRDVLVLPLKENNDRSSYRIYHSTLGEDTVDVNISGMTIGAGEEEDALTFGMWCGGTMGYIPTTRFIYNNVTNKGMSKS